MLSLKFGSGPSSWRYSSTVRGGRAWPHGSPGLSERCSLCAARWYAPARSATRGPASVRVRSRGRRTPNERTHVVTRCTRREIPSACAVGCVVAVLRPRCCPCSCSPRPTPAGAVAPFTVRGSVNQVAVTGLTPGAGGRAARRRGRRRRPAGHHDWEPDRRRRRRAGRLPLPARARRRRATPSCPRAQESAAGHGHRPDDHPPASFYDQPQHARARQRLHLHPDARRHDAERQHHLPRRGDLPQALAGARRLLRLRPVPARRRAVRGRAVPVPGLRRRRPQRAGHDVLGRRVRLLRERCSRPDGYDAIEMLANQPWSNGDVGMVGISYMGISQLFVGQTRPPHLRAITPLSVIADTFRSTLYPGGILNTGFAVRWAHRAGESAQPGRPPVGEGPHRRRRHDRARPTRRCDCRASTCSARSTTTRTTWPRAATSCRRARSSTRSTCPPSSAGRSRTSRPAATGRSMLDDFDAGRPAAGLPHQRRPHREPGPPGHRPAHGVHRLLRRQAHPPRCNPLVRPSRPRCSPASSVARPSRCRPTASRRTRPTPRRWPPTRPSSRSGSCGRTARAGPPASRSGTAESDVRRLAGAGHRAHRRTTCSPTAGSPRRRPTVADDEPRGASSYVYDPSSKRDRTFDGGTDDIWKAEVQTGDAIHWDPLVEGDSSSYVTDAVHDRRRRWPVRAASTCGCGRARPTPISR